MFIVNCSVFLYTEVVEVLLHAFSQEERTETSKYGPYCAKRKPKPSIDSKYNAMTITIMSHQYPGYYMFAHFQTKLIAKVHKYGMSCYPTPGAIIGVFSPIDSSAQ